jgi:dihydrofolate synthase/folylpolyglutamate synthase
LDQQKAPFTSYQNTLAFLFEQLPMFSRIGSKAYKADLNNIIALSNAIGNPHLKFKSIHIAGTNGKGSVSNMLAGILQTSNYKVGLYTSPHILDFRERIRINGVMIAEQAVVDFVNEHYALIVSIQPSFFEITVALAFDYFAKEAVDIAVIETGLGGRLDSTNIITPILSIITNISLDHTDLLGSTETAIAFEKAGIMKPKVPVLIGSAHAETMRVFVQQSLLKGSTLYEANLFYDVVRSKVDATHQHLKVVHKSKHTITDIVTDMLGDFQLENIKTVMAACDILVHYGLLIDMDAIQKALFKIKQITGFMGRWHTVQQQPIVIMDVGHNVAGIKIVAQQLQQLKANRKHIVVGFVKDKEVAAALALLPKEAYYYFVAAAIPRALPSDDLMQVAVAMGLQGIVYSSVAEGVVQAMQAMHSEDVLLVTGSFFVVAEAMVLFPSALK